MAVIPPYLESHSTGWPLSSPNRLDRWFGDCLATSCLLHAVYIVHTSARYIAKVPRPTPLPIVRSSFHKRAIPVTANSCQFYTRPVDAAAY